MLRPLVARLMSATLILLISGGGGGLPVLDGLIYHTWGRRAAEDTRSHYEATSGCHADGCAIRSTAQQSRSAVALGPAGSVSPAPEFQILERSYPTPLSNTPSGQPLSRAPPSLG